MVLIQEEQLKTKNVHLVLVTLVSVKEVRVTGHLGITSIVSHRLDVLNKTFHVIRKTCP